MPVPVVPDPVEEQSRSLGDAVFDRLSRAIIDGTLKEGEQLRDKHLQLWLGVSRTPIRDALARLATLGMIEMLPSRYTRVTTVDAALVRETLEYTGYQSGIALRMAIPRMDEQATEHAIALVDAMIEASQANDLPGLYVATREFMRHITAHTGNRVFIRAMHEAGAALERNLRHHRPVLQMTSARTEWYQKLRAAIAEGDADYAEVALRHQHKLDLIDE